MVRFIFFTFIYFSFLELIEIAAKLLEEYKCRHTEHSDHTQKGTTHLQKDFCSYLFAI